MHHNPLTDNHHPDLREVLFQCIQHPRIRYPSKLKAQAFVHGILSLLFPHFAKIHFYTVDEIEYELICLEGQLKQLIYPMKKNDSQDLDKKLQRFFNTLPEIHQALVMDAESIANGDPAAENMDEVILSYPGFLAIAIFRIAHELYRLGIPFLPRVLTEYAHQLTGVDIHPGAAIGKSFCIDHGTGIVIGETTVIGDHVKIYQGVTLGALSVKKDAARMKRHPTVGNNVVIYSNATILGGKTVIGSGSVIGGNVWLTDSVPDNSVVCHQSEIHITKAKTGFQVLNSSNNK